MTDRGIKQAAALGGIIRLRQQPHELCKARLGRHVERLKHADVGQPAADVVDRKVGTLALYLSGQRDRLSRRKRRFDLTSERSTAVGRPPTPNDSITSAR